MPTNFFSKAFVPLFISAGFLSWCSTPVLGADTDQYKWSVQYLIDNSQPVFGRSQAVFPRNNRGLAITRDRRFIYAGYLRSFNDKGEIRKIDLGVADYESATMAVLPDVVPKALAVDDEGRVYAALGTQISIYDADLTQELDVIPTSTCEGVAVVQTASTVILYGSERERHLLRRWEISAGKDNISSIKQCGFDGDTGEILLPDSVSLRGMAVDSHGRIWIADLGGDQVFRVDPNGKDLRVLKVHAPIGISFDGNKGYITLSQDRTVAIIDEEMNILGTLAVPWTDLELAPFGNNHNGILAEIVADPGKGFYVANALGQTEGQRSTYGRADNAADVINGKLYSDTFADDNEPILHAVITGTGDADATAQPESKNPSNLSDQPNPSDLTNQPNPSDLTNKGKK